jgi:NADH-quinone oxidoreductase subunit M
MMGVVCAFGVILGAVYMLKLYRGVMLGAEGSKEIAAFSDLRLYEKVALLPLVMLIIYVGIAPNEVLAVIDVSVQKLLYTLDT